MTSYRSAIPLTLRRSKLWGGKAIAGTLLWLWSCDLAIATPGKPVPPSCPQELKPLVNQMLRDIPAYANRVYIRSGLKQSYMVLAANPDFNPLPLSPGQPLLQQSSQPQQVFLTTLERMWVKNQPVQVQQYHWLFLSPSPNGWHLVTMYSMTGSYPTRGPATAPRESSEESLAQAIRSWLLDCRSGFLPAKLK